ncbi:hypothetical protein SBOR_7038 [Sclerotinia borealis F-4128]|uniref:Uncharacterized protein n=1 Tax=Sclerotinia borealis (strain F-4128) TaxID=1432307 RepID=W9C9U9_SCLBF|nr:hypothetical protein SBOR_7038 [Sclerotinia borealis F-4128]
MSPRSSCKRKNVDESTSEASQSKVIKLENTQAVKDTENIESLEHIIDQVQPVANALIEASGLSIKIEGPYETGTELTYLENETDEANEADEATEAHQAREACEASEVSEASEVREASGPD